MKISELRIAVSGAWVWYAMGMDEAKKSVYIESTIPSYATARPSANALNLLRRAQTLAFWNMERHKYNLYVSQDVIDECCCGDTVAAQRRLDFIKDIEKLQEPDGLTELAAMYQKLLDIPNQAKTDCIHLAYCVLYHINLLLTWNCTHLGPVSQRKAQTHNDQHSLWTPTLVTPETIYNMKE